MATLQPGELREGSFCNVLWAELRLYFQAEVWSHMTMTWKADYYLCTNRLSTPSRKQIPSSPNPHVMPTLALSPPLSLSPPDSSLTYQSEQGWAQRTCTPQTKVKGRPDGAWMAFPHFHISRFWALCREREPSSMSCSCLCPFHTGEICCGIILSNHLPATKPPPLDVGRWYRKWVVQADFMRPNKSSVN